MSVIEDAVAVRRWSDSGTAGWKARAQCRLMNAGGLASKSEGLNKYIVKLIGRDGSQHPRGNRSLVTRLHRFCTKDGLGKAGRPRYCVFRIEWSWGRATRLTPVGISPLAFWFFGDITRRYEAHRFETGFNRFLRPLPYEPRLACGVPPPHLYCYCAHGDCCWACC